MSMRERIIRRCSRKEGAKAHEVAHCFRPDEREFHRDVRDMLVAEGVLFRIEQPRHGLGGKCQVRYFTDASHGAAWAASMPVITPRKKAAPAPKQVLTIKQPPQRTTAPEGPVIVPPGVKVQRLPSSPVYSRHQCVPGASVPSVVSAGDCRPWAAAAVGAV